MSVLRVSCVFAIVLLVCLGVDLEAHEGMESRSALDATADTSVPAYSATVYFSDDFEGGLGNWTVSGLDWDLTTGESRSSTHSLTDSPGGDYGSGWNVSAVLTNSLDLSGSTAPVLTFWHKMDLGDTDDDVLVEYSSNGGSTWIVLRSWHATDWTTWKLEHINLGGYSNTDQVKIRFRLDADSDVTVDDGWYIDDVEIRENLDRLSYPFYDDFEVGLGNWTVSGYDWDLTTGESRSSSHSLTDSPGGNYGALWDAGVTLVHPIDLTGATAPVLTFWHMMNLGDTGDDALVEYSANGGSTWSVLREWHGSNWTTWKLEHIDLSGYGSTDEVKIRFRLDADSDATVDDGWYIDDVEIRENLDRLSYPFSDDFEGGLGNWTVSGHDWDLTTGESRSSSHSLTDSPGGNYGVLWDAGVTLVHPIDLTGATAPVLTFWHKTSLGDSDDDALVEYSSNGGSTWSVLRAWHGSDWTTWKLGHIDLSGYSGTDEVKIRFRLDADPDATIGDGWYIDDVEIRENLGRLSYPFYDDFEGGLGNWSVSGYDWDLTTADSRSSSHSLTDSPGGDYGALWDAGVTLVHPIDLTGAGAPALTFWHKMNLGDTGDAARVEYSSNGGDTWLVLKSWYGSEWTTWEREHIDLSGYSNTDEVKIRFRLDADSDATMGDGWYIDDVWICENSTAGLEGGTGDVEAISLLGGRPNPFHSMCTISYALPKASRVGLQIFNAGGSLVATLVQDWKEGGVHNEVWSGKGNDGVQLPSGVYFCRLEVDGVIETKRIVFVR
jgi:hypothetical protein